MTNFFLQIRRYTDASSLIKELSDKLARVSGVVEDGIAAVRKMRVDTSKITYTGTSSATIDGADLSASDTDSINDTSFDYEYTYAKGTFKIAGGEFMTDRAPPRSEKGYADYKSGQHGFMQQDRVAVVNVSDVG